MTQRQAFVAAGYSGNQSLASQDQNACHLEAKVKPRINALLAKADDDTIATVRQRKQRLTELLRAGEINPEDITPRDRIAAIAELNKMDHVYEQSVTINTGPVVFVIGSGYKDKLPALPTFKESVPAAGDVTPVLNEAEMESVKPDKLL